MTGITTVGPGPRGRLRRRRTPRRLRRSARDKKKKGYPQSTQIVVHGMVCVDLPGLEVQQPAPYSTDQHVDIAVTIDVTGPGRGVYMYWETEPVVEREGRLGL
jgi:hypothetical protein